MRLSIRQKLLGAFALDLALLVTLGAFAVVQMSRMNETARRVETRTIPSLRHGDEISATIAAFRALQSEMLLQTASADRDRLEHSMSELEQHMDRVLALQAPLLDGAAEQQALDAVADAWTRYLEVHETRFLPAARRAAAGTVHPALSRLNPDYRRLQNATDRLAELTAERASAALGDVGTTHRDARAFLLAGTLLAVVVSAAVGLLLAATLARRVVHLTRAAQSVGEGDLEQRVELTGYGDEITTLADRFNRMVESLRGQRRTLEQRNEELRVSLKAQRALTDDLVERKRSEQRADRARAEAEAREKAKSLFLATMSHELRTPLNAILGYAQLLELEAQRDGTPAADDLGRIRAAGRHLLTLIDNLLDFSKLEQGKVDVELVDFRIDDLAREVVDLLGPLARESGNELELRCTVGDGAMHSDPSKVRQIFFNLLSNAVKFTTGGSVVLELRVAEADDRPYLCAVHDTGIGIAPEHLDRIFEPFRQAEASTHRRFGGSGLGLVVSRQLSELLGGRLDVSSEPGRGSTFTATLPRRAPWPRSSSSTTIETTAA
ncbi:MAG: ATP-binding protein [Acidobacteriota bacterium]